MKDTIQKLMLDYGNAMFDCGEYDNDDPVKWSEEYPRLSDVADEARRKLLDAIEEVKK